MFHVFSEQDNLPQTFGINAHSTSTNNIQAMEHVSSKHEGGTQALSPEPLADVKEDGQTESSVLGKEKDSLSPGTDGLLAQLENVVKTTKVQESQEQEVDAEGQQLPIPGSQKPEEETDDCARPVTEAVTPGTNAHYDGELQNNVGTKSCKLSNVILSWLKLPMFT